MRGSYAMAPRSPVDFEATKTAEDHLMDACTASLEAHKHEKTVLEKDEAEYKAALAASLDGIPHASALAEQVYMHQGLSGGAASSGSYSNFWSRH